MPDADVACTVTNTRNSHLLTLTKILSPSSDLGRFDLTAGGGFTSAAGDAGSASAPVVGGTSTTVSEVANLANGANLNDYTSTLSCSNGAGGTTSASFTMPDAECHLHGHQHAEKERPGGFNGHEMDTE